MATDAVRKVRNKLAGGTGLAAMMVGLLYPTPALAACDDPSPDSGDTVVCDDEAPNPDTVGVRGGQNDVSVVLEDDAGIEYSQQESDAVSLGNGANIALNEDAFIRTDQFNSNAIRVGDTSFITLAPGALIETTGDQSQGIVAGESLTLLLDNATIRNTGEYDGGRLRAFSRGVNTRAGADITLANGSLIQSSDSAIYINQAGATAPSTITLRGGSRIVTTGSWDRVNGNRGVGIDGGARFSTPNFTIRLLEGSEILVDGGGLAGIFTADNADILLDNSSITMTQGVSTVDAGAIRVINNANIVLRNGASISTVNTAAISAALFSSRGTSEGGDDLSVTLGDNVVVRSAQGLGEGGIGLIQGGNRMSLEVLDTARIEAQGSRAVRSTGSLTAMFRAGSFVDGFVEADMDRENGTRTTITVEEGATVTGYLRSGSNATILVDGAVGGVWLRPDDFNGFDFSNEVIINGQSGKIEIVNISDNLLVNDISRETFITIAQGASVSTADRTAIVHGEVRNINFDDVDPTGNDPYGNLTVLVEGTLKSTFGDRGEAFYSARGRDTVILTPTASVNGILWGGLEDGDGFELIDRFILRSEEGSVSTLDLGTSPIGGWEFIDKEGVGTWILRGTPIADDVYTGANPVERVNIIALESTPTLSVLDGTLQLDDANLDTTIIRVSPGATLSGFGSFGDLFVIGDSIVSVDGAGGSAGTLSIGSLTLNSEARLIIDASADGAFDQIVVNGSIDLAGATLHLRDMSGNFFLDADPFNRVIIDNDGDDAVTGEFGNVVDELAFLDPTLVYTGGDGNDVAVSFTPTNMSPPPSPPPPPTPTPPPPPPPPPTGGPEPVPGGLFQTAALTFNQLNSASRLDRLDQTAGTDATGIYMQILFMNAQNARDTFDISSGEIYASLLADGLDRVMVLNDRLMARAHERSSEGWGLWGGVNARSGSVEGDGNAAEVDSDTFGFDIGLDYRGADNAWAAGVALGYFDGNASIEARRSSADHDGWSLGAYGRYGTGNSGPTVTGSVGYSSGSAAVRRNIAFGMLSRDTFASVDVDAFGVGLESRYGLPLGNGWAAGPLLSALYSYGEIGAYSETGASSLNLSSAGASDNVARFGGGLFGNWQGESGGFDLSAQYVDGRSNFSQVSMTLSGAPEASFPVRSPRTNGSAGLFTAAGQFDLGAGWSIGGELRALVGADETNVAGSAVVGWKF